MKNNKIKYIILCIMIMNLFVSGYELEFKKSFSELSDINRGVVNSSRLNVRSGPSTMYPRIEVLYQGDIVNIKRAASESWLEITLPPIKGYIFSEFIDIKDTKENLVFYFDTSEVFTDYSMDTKETFGIVNGNSVNIRLKPLEDAARVAIVNKKVRLKILEKEGDWYKISFLSKRTAYVYSRYISKLKKSKIRMDFTPIFKDPENQDSLIRHLPANMEALIFDRKEGFFKVYIETYNITGWVPEESIIQ
ncbi:MAG: hypothetical protein C0601_11595 [Candidatus Muiribacterium halophilum]|uniref:SH3b domain-containing protein n=1 Tax=Muiribacterium halophilum TaxID=2053465 RepID=A0A2N5ZBE7_MUIH1|nr:MAG: hypothetical protein C0601_11595 [Candidatus Muirbacterium halophilum]